MQTQTAAQTIEKPRKLLDGYLSEAELAAELGYFPQTIRKWRARGEGPPYVLISKSAYYPEAEFRKWLAKRIQTPRGR